VLVAAQPTRGLDVGAIEFVHRRLLDQREAGRAVLLVSLELEEIRSLLGSRAGHLRRADRGVAPA
jgi:simple sugar transport system ATP-binding protein